MLAALRGFRMPDAILSHYPVFSINPRRFFPSMLLSVDEELLSSSFMQFALNCFTHRGGNVETNPILSPAHAPDALLKLLPPVKLMPCEIDPLRDHSFYFANRLLKLGNKCEIYIMKDHIHGWNNIDTNYVGVAEFRRSTTLTESIIR
jgi:hormone-sensitive lipase